MTRETDAIEAPLLARLAALGIRYALHRHPPLHTVAESRARRGDLPGTHVKNLFLRDKKRRLWLVTVPEDKAIDLTALRRRLGASGSLSFGDAALLGEALGVVPGAVTPLAVVNDPAARVTLVLDRAVLALDPVNLHPLHNGATLALAAADLLRFAAATGHPPLLLDLG